MKSEKALEAAAHIFQLRTRKRIEKVESKIQVIDHKLEKKLALLSEKRKCDIEGEKNALKERLENLQSLQKNDSASAHKKIEAKRKIARDLIDSNRVKKRKLGAGAPSLLDSEDEEFIANAIASKSTCHGRRHEATLFTNHRVKKRHFLSLAHYSLMRRGKSSSNLPPPLQIGENPKMSGPEQQSPTMASGCGVQKSRLKLKIMILNVPIISEPMFLM